MPACAGSAPRRHTLPQTPQLSDVAWELLSCAARADVWGHGCSLGLRITEAIASSHPTLVDYPRGRALSETLTIPFRHYESQTSHSKWDRNTELFEFVNASQPANRLIVKIVLSLQPLQLAAAVVQQDASMPYRVEVRLSHSAALCSPPLLSWSSSPPSGIDCSGPCGRV